MGKFHRPWTLPTVKKISGFLRWPVQRTPTEQPHVVSGVLPIGDFDPSCTLPGLKISGLWWACSVDNHLNKPMVQNSSCHSRGTKESSLSMQTPRHPSAHGKSPPNAGGKNAHGNFPDNRLAESLDRWNPGWRKNFPIHLPDSHLGHRRIPTGKPAWPTRPFRRVVVPAIGPLGFRGDSCSRYPAIAFAGLEGMSGVFGLYY
jgi:hypothetical protein